MDTLTLLRMKYGTPCVPLDVVRRDYLSHISNANHLLQVIRSGRVPLRVVRSDWGGKLQRVVYLHDLAEYLDQCVHSSLSERHSSE